MLVVLILAGALAGQAAGQTPGAPAGGAPVATYDQAVKDRLAGRLDKAIEEFRALSKSAPQDADIWLNLGLALTAKGDFDAAEAALKRGLEISPNYSDLTVAYARLAFFRQHPVEARARLEPALGEHPSPDAQELMKQIAAAERDAMGLPWRVDASVSYSNLSKHLTPWREEDVSVGRKLDADSSLALGVEQTSRFAIDNTYLHGEYARRFGAWSGFLGVGGSPNATYRASEFVQAGAGAPALALGGGWSLGEEVDLAYGVYPNDRVTSVTPIATLARGDDLSLSARYLWSSDRAGHAVGGFAVQGVAPLTSYARLSMGYADAPDASTGVVVKVRNYNAGLAVDLGERTSLKFSGAHETGRVYTRDEYDIGLTRRF